jgi:hypothetical protein
MNGSLILNIVSFVLLLTTQYICFAISLELAYMLMPLWAARLAIQIGIFRRPPQHAEMIKKASRRIRRCIERISENENWEIDEEFPEEP